MDDADVDRAVLIGHSNGTPTVRQFARDYLRRTAGLVAVDGALQEVFPREMAQPMLAQLRSANYRSVIEQMFGSMSSEIVDPADREMVEARLAATPQSTIVGGLEAAVAEDVEVDDPIEVPLLVINAPNPMMWTDAYETRVRELADDVEYHTVEGASHFVMMDRPDRFNRIVLNWMASHGW
jgi:pimeloyl-ACP methyl ester carboxylesterase